MRMLTYLWALLMAFAATSAVRADAARPTTFAGVVKDVQTKVVKIYGAGGLRGLEPYQSGFLISDRGHVLTVWSYVLDSEQIVVSLDDGQRFDAKLLGADPRLELAVLKIEAADLPHFKLAQTATAEVGSRVLAFSNLFGVATGEEPVSVLHGAVAAKTELDARRGVFATPYRGTVYVVDAVTNNPGAAGGALTDQRGRLLAMLGKELRSTTTGAWLNYAMPIDQLSESVGQIMAGRFSPRPLEQKSKAESPLELAALGITLVPDILDRTPPYVDAVQAGSAAEQAGLEPDDLVIFIGDFLIPSCRAVREELASLERGSEVKFVVMRGQELIELTVKSSASAQP